MRAGTENIASIVGMAVALKKYNDNIYKNMEKVKNLENHLQYGLRNIGSIFVRNGGGKTLPGLVSLSFEGHDGEAVLHRLDLMGIGISTGSACNGRSTEVSHVLKAIGIRDSLANCIANADFIFSRGIVIKKDLDSLVIENPGSIITGKVQMLKGGISEPRNKVIMKMFNLICVGERAGSGVPDIFHVWDYAGWTVPTVEEQYRPDRTIL